MEHTLTTNSVTLSQMLWQMFYRVFNDVRIFFLTDVKLLSLSEKVGQGINDFIDSNLK